AARNAIRSAASTRRPTACVWTLAAPEPTATTSAVETSSATTGRSFLIIISRGNCHPRAATRGSSTVELDLQHDRIEKLCFIGEFSVRADQRPLAVRDEIEFAVHQNAERRFEKNRIARFDHSQLLG